MPRVIGRYEVRRELGRGMMGVVYEAHDPLLGREIALKVILASANVADDQRDAYEQRFFAEARSAARLSHPGIVVVHDVARDAETGALYMALELLRGRSLDAVLGAGRRLEWRQALPIVRRLAEALHHAHQHGVIHRDVKPANIMLLDTGEPKLMDFGIAKLETSQLTASGQFLGTPLYMSPEQALAHPVDARSDLFSLGSVLYEMVTGRQAFGGESVTKVLFQIMSREPEPPSLHDASLPEALDYLIARCLAKDAAQRYPDGATLVEDIDDLLAGREPRGRAGWRAQGVGGTLIAPAAALATATLAAPRPDPPRAPASARPKRRTPSRRPVLLAAGVALVGVPLGWLLLRPAPVARRLEPAPAAAAAAAPGPAIPEPANEPVRTRGDDAARLTIDFEHTLKDGLLRVWVDDELVVEQDFDGRVTQDIAGLKLRKGRLSEAFAVEPGRREVKVEVAWDDNLKRKTAYANMRPGSRYRLKIKLGSLGGLRKDLSLDWL
jgi:serine/threonine-protein kinase